MTVKLGNSGLDEPRAPLGKIVKLGHSGQPSRTTTTEIGLAAACVFAGLLAFFVLGGANLETDPHPSLVISRDPGCVGAREYIDASRLLARRDGYATYINDQKVSVLEGDYVLKEMRIREREACLDLKAWWSVNRPDLRDLWMWRPPTSGSP